MAVIALGGMVRAAVSAGQVAASWQQVGADAVVGAAGTQTSIGPGAQAEDRGRPRGAARGRRVRGGPWFHRTR